MTNSTTENFQNIESRIENGLQQIFNLMNNLIKEFEVAIDGEIHHIEHFIGKKETVLSAFLKLVNTYLKCIHTVKYLNKRNIILNDGTNFEFTATDLTQIKLHIEEILENKPSDKKNL
ncbi:hypothetical protein [Rickettsiales endosymbiont of Stachyamoeba lipophora]|uniref:hypothetical protein n=1 Tax=Rickettsiales endosymbiont of Stachyamoeba lipophora TaxID=2486578 RepID=UPI000F64B6C6|nr:hypothetical protein [Rickettsiales endosymbiont of Stachyamoeba lipophora]AZL16315.1 hypothetical protein EF513_07230 [Rickettsiales endosymbiont of Stachyamoeba lipophora]